MMMFDFMQNNVVRVSECLGRLDNCVTDLLSGEHSYLDTWNCEQLWNIVVESVGSQDVLRELLLLDLMMIGCHDRVHPSTRQ